eukprot:3113293-Rhodomonas_salina.1
MKLLTIPASHYCEKARWALHLAKLPFTEIGHAPILSYMSTMPRGTRAVPVLLRDDGSQLNDSSDIVKFCGESVKSLYPNKRAEELEKYYSDKLGPHTRRW